MIHQDVHHSNSWSNWFIPSFIYLLISLQFTLDIFVLFLLSSYLSILSFLLAEYKMLWMTFNIVSKEIYNISANTLLCSYFMNQYAHEFYCTFRNIYSLKSFTTQINDLYCILYMILQEKIILYISWCKCHFVLLEITSL